MDRLPCASLPIVGSAELVFLAHYSEVGLVQLEFFPTPKKPLSVWIEQPEIREKIAAWHKLTSRAVKQVLAGKTVSELPPLDLRNATDFQRNVWRALSRIPPGTTRTYGEIAREIGDPNAVRAVGRGCATNPIPILIPCHRVVAAHGKIGGFSGGLKWKELLLKREGVLFV